MKWYQNLYVGESAAKKKKKIIWKLRHNAGMVNVYVITLASNGHDLFDIISSSVLSQKAARRNCPMIVGIACGYQEALELALSIVLKVYEETGDFKVCSYLNKQVDKK